MYMCVRKKVKGYERRKKGILMCLRNVSLFIQVLHSSFFLSSSSITNYSIFLRYSINNIMLYYIYYIINNNVWTKLSIGRQSMSTLFFFSAFIHTALVVYSYNSTCTFFSSTFIFIYFFFSSMCTSQFIPISTSIYTHLLYIPTLSATLFSTFLSLSVGLPPCLSEFSSI